PLTNATRLYYTATGGTAGDLEANISYDVGMSNSKGYPVYKVAIDGDELTLDLYFRTTTSQIELLGVDGPVSVGDADIDYLRFGTPIKLIGAQSSKSTTATATIRSNGDDLSDTSITIDYGVANRNSTFNNATTTNSKTWKFPTLKSTLTADIKVVTSGLALAPFPIVLEFDFTKGLGMVQHSGNLSENSSADYEAKFDRLLDLPNIMTSVSYAFTMAESQDNLSSADYRVLNQSELNSLGWLTISQDANSNWVIAEINSGHEDYPTELTSYQVLFENKHSDARLSGNITIDP
ncbi:MAG: hypothetical protein D9N11_13745, partial [Ketobacter sp.]